MWSKHKVSLVWDTEFCVQVKCCLFGQSGFVSGLNAVCSGKVTGVFGVNAAAWANYIFGISVNIHKYTT